LAKIILKNGDKVNLSKQLVGGILVAPEKFFFIRNLMTPEALTDDNSRVVYGYINTLIDDKQEISTVRVSNMLKRDGKDENIVNELMCDACIPSECVEIAKVLQDNHSLMQFANLGERLALMSRSEDINSVSEYVKSETNAILKNRATVKKRSIQEIMKSEDNQEVDFVETGYPQLDMMLPGGMEFGGITILAGSPGTGKSQFAINIMLKSMLREKQAKCLYLCLEMNEKQIQDRMIGVLSGIPLKAIKAIRTGVATEGTFSKYGNRYIEAIEELATREIDIVCQGALTVDEINNILIQNIDNSDLIIIDHLHKIQRRDSKQSDMEKINDGMECLNWFAGRYNKPILCLCQLSREGYKLNTKPTMAHLRDSGKLEQDACNVMLLWRDDDNKAHGGIREEVEQELEMNIGKCRNGKEGRISFNYKMDKGVIRPYTG